MSYARVSNSVRVFLSYKLAQITKKPIHWGKPITVSIEPTTACNLGCPECPSGLKQFTRPTGNLKPEFYESILDQLLPELSYLTFYFQGEPYINPSFLDMVAYASKRGVHTSTSTNAHFIDEAVAKRTVESGLDRLIISVDGTSQEVYEKYRINGSLDKVLEGTKNIVAAKKAAGSSTPHIVFQFLVVRHNEHQIDELKSLAKEYGVDEVKFKTAQIYDYKKGSPLMPENEEYARYAKQADGSFAIKNEMLNHCWRLWQGCVITWDGGVVPCCFDKDASHQLGHTKSASFMDIWRGEAYQQFRTNVLSARSEVDICTNCTEGTKVWN